MLTYIAEALYKANDDVHEAWLDLKDRRQTNQYDLSLAAAEQYMFARRMGETWWMPAGLTWFLSGAYGLLKENAPWMVPRFGHGPVSPYSDEQYYWQLQGLEKGQADWWWPEYHQRHR